MPLKTPATELSPEVMFDPACGLLSMEGECYPENAVAFFAPLLAEMKCALTVGTQKAISAAFRLRYVNSASSRALRRVLVLLDTFAREGGHVVVRWHHEQDDEVSEELGKELIADLHFIEASCETQGAEAGVPV